MISYDEALRIVLDSAAQLGMEFMDVTEEAHSALSGFIARELERTPGDGTVS